MDRSLINATLRRDSRLREAEVFRRALQGGSRIKSRHFELRRLEHAIANPRLGCVVPKRLTALAVGRNRIKRLAREAFRVRRLLLPNGDIVFRQIAKVDPKDPSLFREIEDLFQALVNTRSGR